jgi:alanyl-tRNA synthetase
MKGNEIRAKYLAFMEARGHAVIPSAPLVPQNDPTTLFTGSGMQPLIPYLMGEPHPLGTRLTDSQKCFRAEDIEEVGDNRHTTFFEMLGNWSLGDYFKAEQLPWFYTFLTKEVGLDPQNLYVTAFIGDQSTGVPRDEESARIWTELFARDGVTATTADMGSEEDGGKRGMKSGERIFYYDAAKNWWSRSGKPEKMPVGEIGGPDSEVFYDFGTPHDPAFGPACHPNCDCGRFLEIGNSVFIEYVKEADGSFVKLPQRNVDFGGGLERIAAAANGDADIFRIDILATVIDGIAELSGKTYEDNTIAFRVIADHIRGATFMIGDNVLPSNTEQGYFVRRLLRRSVRYADMLGIPEGTFAGLAERVITLYGSHYPNLTEKRAEIMDAIAKEEAQFRKTLEKGMREFEKIAAHGTISGEDAFILFTTYGFPYELTEELARERSIAIDRAGFDTKMSEHQARSRAGAEQKFKGGLADGSEETTRLHTTHHLLLKALQTVLGPEVHQRGSNITAERLRIDFNYGEKMTDDQKREVERIVNEAIDADLPVVRSTLPKEEAEKLGAEHEFGAKYPDMVSVYSVGPKGATEAAPAFREAFSIEFCGGPHVTHTGEIAKSGHFRIAKEEASSAGVRRIKAVLE